jgi:hypothetical protein
MRVLLAPGRRLWLPLLVCGVAAAGCQYLGSMSATNASAEPDPKNELPSGFIDAPPNGAGVGRQIQMYGWAVDDQGVKEVRIFVDGKYVAKTTLTAARPDVTRAQPQYAHGNDTHGWALTVTLGDVYQPGQHTILAQAVDTQGATRDIGTITVSVGP